MNVKERMDLRRQVLENKEVQKLIKHAKKNPKKLTTIILQSSHGVDLDYIPGQDDGEWIEPKKEHE